MLLIGVWHCVRNIPINKVIKLSTTLRHLNQKCSGMEVPKLCIDRVPNYIVKITIETCFVKWGFYADLRAQIRDCEEIERICLAITIIICPRSKPIG